MITRTPQALIEQTRAAVTAAAEGNPLLTERLEQGVKADGEREERIPEFLDTVTRLNARTLLPIYTMGQLHAALDAIGGHNSYVALDAMQHLCPLVGACMAVDVEHWNGGPAVYFTMPFWLHQVLSGRHGALASGDQVTVGERIGLAQEIVTIGKLLHASTITTEQHSETAGPRCNALVVARPGPYPFRVRLWWD